MKIRALLLVSLICFWSPLGFAQETPREIIINEITLADLVSKEQAPDQVSVPPAAAEIPLLDPIVEAEQEPQLGKVTMPEKAIEEEVVLTDEIVPEEAAPDNKPSEIAEVVEVIINENMEVDLELEIVQELEEIQPQPEVTVPPSIAAFYNTTEEYLTLRGQGKAPQLILNYDVSTQKTGMLWPVTTKIQLILGDDFAAMKTEPIRGAQIIKIYDFKLARLLTVSSNPGQKDANANFDNISLYAPIYRNIRTVRGATQDGQLKTITLGGGKKLEAFWIESAMSWAVNPSETALTIKKSQTNLTIYKDKKNVLGAEFSNDDYSRDGFKQALLGLAAHEWPMHPQILDAFAKFSSPPKIFTMLSYSPSALEGETQTWTLVDSHETKAEFPLPATALSISQRQPVAPLVFVIGQAVKGEAFDGAQTKAELESDFVVADEGGDGYALWLIGQRYNSYTGKCDQDPDAWLCIRLAEFEENYDFGERESELDAPLSTFIQGVRLAKDSAKRTEALELLEPFLNDPDVPAIILHTAAMARAKLKPSELTNPSIAALNPEKLLYAALAKDPYDPNIYLGLAQISAANEAYEASWDFYDVLRTGAANLGTIEYKIDTVESKLRTDAPRYFVQTK